MRFLQRSGRGQKESKDIIGSRNTPPSGEHPKFEKPQFPAKALSEEQQKALQISKISLWLDRYEDIFSDFDPRHFSQRALSDDFISEAKKVAKERSSGVAELILLIPSEKRNMPHEAVIKKRLREHFKINYDYNISKVKEIVKEGGFFLILGMFLMIASAYILFKFPQRIFFSSFLTTLFEPASWFLFWEGLWLIIFERKSRKQSLDFYKKMSKCDVKFYTY